jgi:hypothetical protein
MRGETAKTLISVKLCGILPASGRSIQVLEKISQVYGGKHLIFMNIPPIKEEGYYAYSLRQEGFPLTFIISRCKIL